MKKYTRWMIVIAILLALSVCLLPINREIHQRFSCNVLDQEDSTYLSHSTVTFTGTYTDYLFLKDSFEGRIDVEDFPLLSENAAPLLLTVGDYAFNHIRDYDTSSHSVSYPAVAYLSEDLEGFFLWINVPSETVPGASRGRYFVCWPEMTLEEVYAVLDR